MPPPSWARRAAARARCSTFWARSSRRPPAPVTLDGRDPFQLPAAQLAAFRNASVGFVFQDHCLLPQCTVLENVLIPTLVAPGRNGDGGRDTERARAGRAGRPRPAASIIGPASCRAASGSGSPSPRARPRAAAAALRRADRQPRSRLRATASRRCCSICTASSRAHPHRRHPQRAARGELPDPLRSRRSPAASISVTDSLRPTNTITESIASPT